VAHRFGCDRAVASDLLAAATLGDGGDYLQLALAEARLQRQPQAGLLCGPMDMSLEQGVEVAPVIADGFYGSAQGGGRRGPRQVPVNARLDGLLECSRIVL